MKKISQKGFTLIELLIVIGIIAILAAAVIITITPGQRLREAREATRSSHMTAIGTALHMGVVDRKITSLTDSACVASGTFANFTDDCAAVVGLSKAPVDPQNSGLYEVRAILDSTRIEVKTPSTTPADGSLEMKF